MPQSPKEQKIIKMRKTFEYLLASILLLTPLFLYWWRVEAFNFYLSTSKADWKEFGEFFGGLYGPLVAGMGLYFLGKQIRVAQEANTIALKSFITAQETNNFEITKFQLILIINRIEKFNKLSVTEEPSKWALTFKLLLCDMLTIETSYRKTFQTNASQTAIQTLFSQTINWFLKNNEVKYEEYTHLFFLEQNPIFRDMNFKEITEILDTLKSSRLGTVGDDKPIL